MKYEPVFWDIETTGLNPMAQPWWNSGKNQVTCVGMATIHGWRDGQDPEDVEIDVVTVSGNSEYNVIERVPEAYKDLTKNIPSKDEMVQYFPTGFRSRSFDHPFYCARAGRLRLRPWPFGHQTLRLDTYRVIWKRLGGPKDVSQDQWVEEIGMGPKEDQYDGSDMPQLFEDGRMDAIEHHCRTDLIDLANIFLHDREEMMAELYDHYDEIDGDPPKFTESKEY